MKVLGINLSHNASFSIVENGELILSLEQERVSRQKRDNQINRLCEGLKNSHFEIIGYTSYNMVDEKVESYTDLVKYCLKKNNITYDQLIPYDEHHLTHCYSSFYNSGFDEAVCLIIDNGGTSYTVDNTLLGQENISVYKLSYTQEPKLLFKLCRDWWGRNISIGDYHTYNCMSPAGVFEMYKDTLGFKEPGSVMGLSSYGKENSEIPQLYDNTDLFCKLNISFNDVITRRKTSYPKGTVPDEDFCYRIQKDTTEVVKKYIELIMKNHSNNICLSGGYFQNSIANYEFLKMNNNIFVDPVCHDGGTSIGLAQHLDFTVNKNKPKKYKSLYQGPIYKDQEKLLDGYKPNKTQHSKQGYKIINNYSPKKIAELLKNNKSVAIYQGRSEMGPRALGNRSILYNPSDPKAKEKVNLIKNREWFRPYAGTVLFEHTKDWFDLQEKKETPFMSYVVGVKKDKLNQIPGICHIDNTCRIQTLKKTHNENFYNIINEFYKLTGIPVVLNTSLNSAGSPLVESIEDVLNFMLTSNIDYVYFPEFKKVLSR
tara:strand:- start:4499 stop:6121 length:1623 start_codon:yes stop_codon:yes gene_type:complete